MAPKRASRNVKTKIIDYNSLSLKDVLCPICRSVLIEPVTLPCNHGFCASCFDGTMENANLVCPLCRIRIGSWLRKTKKENKLINHALWDAIKTKFPQQIKNKMHGLDENLEEESEIIVSYPGEIRKEYEMQKKKEDEEFRKRCEADLKASEDLIRKICEEEDFERSVMEEKLKLDEQVAKKLAEELASTSPSTSKVKQTKIFGPMDKFVNQEKSTLQNDRQRKQLNNFATKEYTCRVLCLDNNTLQNDSEKKIFSPIIPKKIQQIQKIADADVTSDSSDCIESELRYFKPIDYRGNPPSEKKPAIRVPTKKLHQNTTARILSPTGLINFRSNILESAFARITLSKPDIHKKEISMSNTSTAITPALNKTPSNDDTNSPKRKMKRKSSVEHIVEEESPTLNNFSKTSKRRRQLFGKSNNMVEETSLSPPFLGFERYSGSKDINSIITNSKNGTMDIVEDEKSKKLLQEMADLEFAKKLQDELNRSTHYTRSTRRTIANSKRQATLDEMIKTPYRVK